MIHVNKGDKVLILGGSSGTGIIAIQVKYISIKK
jgi:NADPH:quinone reductase-like Zn-dependent oxidoreductase